MRHQLLQPMPCGVSLFVTREASFCRITKLPAKA
jgi:hypothetical protein